MLLSLLGQVVLAALLASAFTPTPTLTRRTNGPLPPSQFVTTQNGQFFFNGTPIAFVGTNAYWLPILNSDQDIDFTLGNMSKAGITVVRTWAFNDVQTIPENGTWFQLIANGATTINNGTNGLQKLDTVVRLAEKHNIFLQLALTNNWNPLPLLDNVAAGLSISARDVTNGTNTTLPRNTLSNDYGGMDVYVRALSNSTTQSHDDFYSNPMILNTFMNYTTQIVTRYANSPAIFGWELANDPRCNSSISGTSQCSTLTVTQWHSQVAQHVSTVDPNHLVTSGNHGFFCVDCPKLFPRVTPQPSPSPSPAPGVRRRSPKPKPLTKYRLLQERRAAWKRFRDAKKRSAPGQTIRGRWIAPETRRQFDQGMGSAFDGSSGVDSEDIINIPQIGYGSFQLFPDQNSYGPDDPNLPAFNNTVQQGLLWIQKHAQLGQLFGKPVSLTGFGLVTQNNTPFFVPFNTTEAPFASDNPPTATPVQQPFVTDDQRDDAYTQWLEAGLQNGLNGMLQYQWSQDNLTTQVGTAIQPTVSGTDVQPTVTGTGLSPNDGYSIQGQGLASVVNTIMVAAQGFAADTPGR
ncbi:glycoside hydrolase family 5 protein [Phlegmacium glaucopus]|nr:glycoside hydrolase family 5 protein [Phlegmacium glaucopus]